MVYVSTFSEQVLSCQNIISLEKNHNLGQPDVARQTEHSSGKETTKGEGYHHERLGPA